MSLVELSADPAPVEEPYPYEAAAFHQCWWQYLSPRFDITARHGDLLIHRKRKVKSLFTLRELRIAGWNNAWSQDLTESRAYEFLHLAKNAAWDCFRMTWAEARADHQAFHLLRNAGYTPLQLPAPPQHVITLDKGFDGYLASLSGNGRTSMKKKIRKAQGLNPQMVACQSERDLDGFFEEFFGHHIRYWNEKAGGSYFHDAHERDFIVNWAKALHQSGHLVAERLILADQTANLGLSIVFGTTRYWLLTINTGLHQEYAPGVVGLSMQVRESIEQGITRFNMGAGDYFYKVQSANHREACHELVICNPRSLHGKLYRQWLLRQRQPAKDV